jgi:hypothetical protein
MAQPPAYTPVHSFITDAAVLANFPGQQIDVELNALKITTDAIRANLALVQRDDGALNNGIVTYDSLAASIQSNGLAGANSWVTATTYLVGVAVYQNNNLYRCIVGHTSGTFATDLAAGYWTLVVALPMGATGTPAGINYTFDTSTTMAAPAAGALRFNNSALASVTAIAFNVQTADTGNPNVATTLLTFDDSTNTAHRGILLIRKVLAPQNYAIFDITGSITDNTTWQQHTVTFLNGNGSFSASDAVIVTWIRTGDKGADGTIAGSTGGTANRALRSSGVGGATLQNSLVTIDDSGNVSGVGTLSTSGAISPTNLANYQLTISGGFPQFLSDTGDYYIYDRTNNQHAWYIGTVQVLNQSASTLFVAGTLDLGNAADTTLSRASAGVIAVEGVNLTANVPITSKSVAYTVVLGDANTAILHPTADNNARTFTIDSNANVAYPVGTQLCFINQINTVTIAITTDTLTMLGSGSTGSRTLAANGMATATKITSTSWVISGVGLT